MTTLVAPKTDRCIAVKRGYEYVVQQDYHSRLSILGYRVSTPFFELYEDGTLIIKQYYAYDGPSGTTIDTLDALRTAAEHDVGYQMLREKLIPPEYKAVIDQRFYEVFREDQAVRERLKPKRRVVRWLKTAALPIVKPWNASRARIWYWAVDTFGAEANKHQHPVEWAPCTPEELAVSQR